MSRKVWRTLAVAQGSILEKWSGQTGDEWEPFAVSDGFVWFRKQLKVEDESGMDEATAAWDKQAGGAVGRLRQQERGSPEHDH